VLFEILASATAYGSTVVVEVGAGSQVVWGLRSLAFAFFLLGIATGLLALAAELAPSPRGQKAVELAVVVPAIIAFAALGIYIGARVATPNWEGGTVSNRFAARLNHVISGLSRERDAGVRRLRQADTQQKQASAAKALAIAFSKREQVVLRIPTSSVPDVRSSTRRIAAGLRLVATAYEAVEAAVLNRGGSQAELDRARSRVARAERKLRESQSALATRGYLTIFG
jgi:hypothetical protein